jgi:Arc/MetJ-type ribon-helix-helix transcriptional regulator
VNITIYIPADLQTHINAQIQAGVYSSAVEYFLNLGQQDRQQQSNRSQISQLLQAGLDSASELVTLEYWLKLRTSIFNAEPHQQ